MALRFLGLLEGVELWTFDRMLQFRLPEPPDPRIVIIELTEADFPEQNITKLPASKLIQALNTIKPLNPGIIGLDFNHSYISYVNEQENTLTTTLKYNPNIISICLQPTVNTEGKIVKEGSKLYPAEQVSRDRIGFSNFSDDGVTEKDNGIIRRQKLVSAPLTSNAVTPKPGSEDCTVTESFSLLIARRWLRANKKFSYSPPDLKNLDRPIKLDNVALSRVNAYTGGYWNRDIRDYQILLNYRPGKLARRVALDQFLGNPNGYRDWIQNNIVLIGLTDETDKISDHSFTPYGKLPGVEIHAHMISQLLSATLNGRSLLWSFPEGGEIFCIWVGALGGSLVALGIKKPRRFWQVAILLLLGYGFVCYFNLAIWGFWLPTIPVGLGFLLAAGWLRYQKSLKFRVKFLIRRP